MYHNATVGKIAANPDRVAVPLSGPGGKIAVLELNKTGRLPDGVMPALVHGTTIMDFQWNPFDNEQLAVGKANDYLYSCHHPPDICTVN